MRQAQLGALTILAITRAERAFFASEGTAWARQRPRGGGFIAVLGCLVTWTFRIHL